MSTEQQITDLKNRHAKRLLSQKGVSGIGVEKDDAGGYVLAVYVSDPATAIPNQIEGFPLKIVVSGIFGRNV
jgi:hypothetical protein